VAGSVTNLAPAGGGDAIMHFSIDSGGVETIIAEDELQFRGDAALGFGNNILQIDLIGEPASTDIILVQADRLNTNGPPSGAANEHFTNLLEGATIQRDFGTSRYIWTLDYTDGSDDGVLDASVALRFVEKQVIPEPGGLALLAAGGLMLARRRRERHAC
jgi:hypothetical protein